METLRKLEQVYDIIEDYAKKMAMVVSQRAHWVEDKHCMISVQLQQKGTWPETLQLVFGIPGSSLPTVQELTVT